MDYLDFGTSSESDEDDGMICELDSDEEERRENKHLLKMLNLRDPPSRNQRNIQDFEAEMEAELDRRALEVEVKGGMEHQKSLSRSSSNTSLNKSPRASPVPSSSSADVHNSIKKSNLKRQRSQSAECNDGVKTKSVKFASSEETTEQNIQPHASTSTKKTAEKLYDELYFDSDEDDDEKNKNFKERRRFMTDDELFYDPSSDAKDQAWIDKKRRKAYGESKSFPPPLTHHEGSSSTSVSSGSQAQTSSSSSVSAYSNLPSTDAILNCPACFTTICHDCQRHELYVGQYRAMFVSNCVVNRQETLRIPEKTSKKNRKSKNIEKVGFINDSGSDVFHPVMCRTCRTQVAMYDNDEVYHFFNVLASQP